ncbi:hypothetical protein CRE_07479 [Caenorhabditis remanei]|uniref:Uncharacterized protein n=1 Tax=Caenorhabditis remanei TaxID=31234 RepID=E3M2S5_CAERE|nr:hypothetical protein CRE_07479 [Caenorhabditis remanei]
MALTTSSSTPAPMNRPAENGRNMFRPPFQIQMVPFHGFAARSGPIQRALERMREAEGAGPSPPVQQPDAEGQEEVGRGEEDRESVEEDNEDAEEDEDDEDENLMRQMRSAPRPPPSQFDRFQRWIQIGFFQAAIETFTERSGTENVEEVRKNAEKTMLELIAKSGELYMPDINGKPLCGTPKMIRELKRMSKHVDYFRDLLKKFLEEFDGSPLRVSRLRRATGFMKGIMTFDKSPVYNNPKTPAPNNYDLDIEIFEVNAQLFLEYLRTYWRPQLLNAY